MTCQFIGRTRALLYYTRGKSEYILLQGVCMYGPPRSHPNMILA